MASRLRVAVAGATGETGSSIMNGLLADPEKFEVTALARPASAGKLALLEFSKRGAMVKSVDLSEVSDAVVEALTGMDAVISCLTGLQYKEQMTLIEASSRAKVGRYVPSFFGPACPPRGVMPVREQKENMLDRIKCLYLPYTVIDFGWWYQLSLPRLPSGRIQTKWEYATDKIIGNVEAPIALVDNRDIGKYVARIIADPRTLNKMVFSYGEVWKQNHVWDTLETLSGESIVREHLQEGDIANNMSRAQAMLSTPGKSSDIVAMTELAMTQYKYSLGIRGDNTPEHAKYLGYLDVKELYPDVDAIPLKNFIEETLQGKLRAVYSSS